MIANHIPQEVINAAELIGEWTRNHGYETFYIGPVADRQSHEKLTAELEVEEKRFNDLTDDFARLADENKRLREALEEITSIEDEMYGGDWDEIEKARIIARAALKEKP